VYWFYIFYQYNILYNANAFDEDKCLKCSWRLSFLICSCFNVDVRWKFIIIHNLSMCTASARTWYLPAGTLRDALRYLLRQIDLGKYLYVCSVFLRMTVTNFISKRNLKPIWNRYRLKGNLFGFLYSSLESNVEFFEV